jgi:hypothetical protein
MLQIRGSFIIKKYNLKTQTNTFAKLGESHSLVKIFFEAFNNCPTDFFYNYQHGMGAMGKTA